MTTTRKFDGRYTNGSQIFCTECDCEVWAHTAGCPGASDPTAIESRTRARERRAALKHVQIEHVSGYCPVQIEGTVDGVPFYFRARGEHWSIGIGADPVLEPQWFVRHRYSDTKYAAGWRTPREAVDFVIMAIAAYRMDQVIEAGRPSATVLQLKSVN